MVKAEDLLKKGALGGSLTRGKKQILEARALDIVEETEFFFRNKMEALQKKITKLHRKRRMALDLSPDNVDSLIVAKNFDAEDFYDVYDGYGLEIRELQIKLNNTKTNYKHLFEASIEDEEFASMVATEVDVDKTNQE